MFILPQPWLRQVAGGDDRPLVAGRDAFENFQQDKAKTFALLVSLSW